MTGHSFVLCNHGYERLEHLLLFPVTSVRVYIVWSCCPGYRKEHVIEVNIFISISIRLRPLEDLDLAISAVDIWKFYYLSSSGVANDTYIYYRIEQEIKSAKHLKHMYFELPLKILMVPSWVVQPEFMLDPNIVYTFYWWLTSYGSDLHIVTIPVQFWISWNQTSRPTYTALIHSTTTNNYIKC